MGIDGPYKGDEERRILYQAEHPGAPIEFGRVSSWNSAYVFVRFDGETGSKACHRSRLEWSGE